MVLQEQALSGWPNRPRPRGKDDELRKLMAEERTGQIVTYAPNIGFVALGDLYYSVGTKFTESPNSQNTEPIVEINPDQLAL